MCSISNIHYDVYVNNSDLCSSPLYIRSLSSPSQLIDEHRRRARVVYAGLSHELEKSAREGKSCVISGSHIDLELYKHLINPPPISSSTSEQSSTSSSSSSSLSSSIDSLTRNMIVIACVLNMSPAHHTLLTHNALQSLSFHLSLNGSGNNNSNNNNNNTNNNNGNSPSQQLHVRTIDNNIKPSPLLSPPALATVDSSTTPRHHESKRDDNNNGNNSGDDHSQVSESSQSLSVAVASQHRSVENPKPTNIDTSQCMNSTNDDQPRLPTLDMVMNNLTLLQSHITTTASTIPHVHSLQLDPHHMEATVDALHTIVLDRIHDVLGGPSPSPSTSMSSSTP
jgi:hypothetical protein